MNDMYDGETIWRSQSPGRYWTSCLPHLPHLPSAFGDEEAPWPALASDTDLLGLWVHPAAARLTSSIGLSSVLDAHLYWHGVSPEARAFCRLGFWVSLCL